MIIGNAADSRINSGGCKSVDSLNEPTAMTEDELDAIGSAARKVIAAVEASNDGQSTDGQSADGGVSVTRKWAPRDSNPQPTD